MVVQLDLQQIRAQIQPVLLHVGVEDLGLEAALGARQIEEDRVVLGAAAGEHLAVDRPIEMDRPVAAADRPVVGLEVRDLLSTLSPSGR